MNWRTILLAVMLLIIPVGMAQDFVRDPNTITDDEVNAVASQMFCMECENIPLDVCGTQACIQWREEIRLQLAEGKTNAEILEYFRVNHGERALAVPRDPLLRGLTTITPYLLVIVALVVVVMLFLRWSQGGSSVTSAPLIPLDDPGDNDDPYLDQLERDVNSG